MSQGKDRPPEQRPESSGLPARVIPFSRLGGTLAPRTPLQRFELLQADLRSLRLQFARTLEELAAAPPRPWDEEFLRGLAPPLDAAFGWVLRLTSVLTGAPEDDGDRRA